MTYDHSNVVQFLLLNVSLIWFDCSGTMEAALCSTGQTCPRKLPQERLQALQLAVCMLIQIFRFVSQNPRFFLLLGFADEFPNREDPNPRRYYCSSFRPCCRSTFGTFCSFRSSAIIADPRNKFRIYIQYTEFTITGSDSIVNVHKISLGQV